MTIPLTTLQVNTIEEPNYVLQVSPISEPLKADPLQPSCESRCAQQDLGPLEFTGKIGGGSLAVNLIINWDWEGGILVWSLG